MTGPETHGPGFLPGDTADVYRWILVPSSTITTFRFSSRIPDHLEAGADIVARWDAATEEIEL